MIYHIDISNQYHQNKYSVLAIVSTSQNNQLKKGIVITDPVRKMLVQKYSTVKVHSALISILIEELIPFNRVTFVLMCNPCEIFATIS